jgi:hypothetical protein
MESETFDAVARALSHRRSRRAATGVLGGLLSLPLLASIEGDAKRHKRKKRKGGGKNKGKGKGKGGDTCVPNCGNAKCNVSDGCGGTCSCSAGSICASGTCQACDVIHTGNDVSSGEALRQKMAIPLDRDSYVYVCPGRYAGYFVHAGGNVVGAGSGTDPATSTILKAGGTPDGSTNAVLAVANGALGRINDLRIAGSSTANLHGVYVPAGSTMTLENCAVTGTRGFGAYGVMVNGTFNALETSISGNGPLSPSVSGGGGMYVDTPSGVLLEDCRVVDNQAYTSDGGGITLYKGNMSIFSTEISGNKALGGAAYRGGGLYSNFGTVFMNSETRITGNSAGTAGGGGIFRVDRGDAYRIFLEGATVSGNSPDNCRNVAGCTG